MPNVSGELVRRRMMALALLFAPGLIAGVMPGCTQHMAAAYTFELSILAENDEHEPLASVSVLRDARPLATTGVDGRARVSLAGAEGDRVQLQIRCPEHYVSPSAPLEVSLRKLEEASRLASYRVSCPPEIRTVVVAVRATRGPNLPVLYLGREVARTDDSGAAHVQLRLRSGERFELALSTREEGAERLIPQNPIAVFLVRDRDEVLFFEQRFEQTIPKTRARRLPQQF